MNRLNLVIATLAILLPASPVAAGELWSDFDEDRVDICPAEGEFPADQVSEYVAYNVHELAKSVDFYFRDADSEFEAPGGQPYEETAYDFTLEAQRSLRNMVDSAMFFSRNMLAPMQRIERADGATLDRRIVSIVPPIGKGTKERLKIGFVGYLTTARDENAEIIYDYLDALRTLNEWVPVDELIDENSLRSHRLRFAIDEFRAAYGALKPVLFDAIEAPGYAAMLERQVWAACFAKPVR